MSYFRRLAFGPFRRPVPSEVRASIHKQKRPLTTSAVSQHRPLVSAHSAAHSFIALRSFLLRSWIPLPRTVGLFALPNRCPPFQFEEGEHCWHASVQLGEVPLSRVRLTLKDTTLRLSVSLPAGLFFVWASEEFSRSITVPAGLVVGDIDAVYDDGTLRIAYPKQPRPMPNWPFVVEPEGGWASDEWPVSVPIINARSRTAKRQQDMKQLDALGFKNSAMNGALLDHYGGNIKQALATLVGLAAC